MLRVPSLKNLIEVFSIQGRILVALLALLGASMASAATGDETGQKKFEGAWRLTEPMKLEAASITMGPNYANPTYSIKFQNGETMQLAPTALINLSGLSKSEIKEAAENTRVILEGITNLLLSKQKPTYSVVRGGYAVSVVTDQKWLLRHNLQSFDPLASVAQAQDSGATESEFVVAGEPTQAEAETPVGRVGRMRRFYSYIRDVIWTSAVAAGRHRRASNDENKDKIQEWGFQIAFRGELQLGFGKKSFTRNIPVMLSVGYNREKRTMVFRRGYRKETMADGVGILAGWKVEFRRYRLFADGADAADPRPNFAKLKGTSWYPPSIPVVSPVADSAPGYQSEGFAIGTSIQNLFLPQTLWLDIPFALMNTVTSFEETQRVYSAPIPDPAAMMRKFHDQLKSSGMFAGSSPGGRCEALFVPMPIRAAR